MAAREGGSKVVKAFLIGGIILGFLGVSGIFWLSLPDTETTVVAGGTPVRLDGRYFGHLSGSYSCSLNVSYLRFFVLDQHDWDSKSMSGYQTNPLVASYGLKATFSSDLPASHAYYMFFDYASPPSPDYVGPIIIQVHWHVWGPTIAFSSVYSSLILAGTACVLFSYYYRWRLFLTT